MAGHFTVVVADFPESKTTPRAVASVMAYITVESHGGYKGTVDLTYSCAADSGTDPTLNRYSQSLYVDQGNNPTDGVLITGDPGFTFTACGQEQGGPLSDCDSKHD